MNKMVARTILTIEKIAHNVSSSNQYPRIESKSALKPALTTLLHPSRLTLILSTLVGKSAKSICGRLIAQSFARRRR
jgi:hypothetical protein